ncbi:HU family DNA-binding protein [Acinetobacter pittii]|uniref:HU family DNA-binding protein n=1 Tax=Acinetobacter pittii TaxID=48296 RepID=UPI0002E320C0|nr:HU family DNA-binding protein [Acinetobacter pittii]MDX8275325.1 HU family DNA-binding protein [Acinetobacter pittii]SSP16727.1 DNA-binding protein HU [Acinetobacter pittii]
MNKTELTKHVAQRAGLTQTQALAAISALETTITNVLRGGGDVTLIGFGSFTVKERAARTGRNPKTGEELQIAAAKVPSFKAGKALKEAVK